MNAQQHYDVIVIGGSVAGCTAATLLGRGGLKVAVLERKASIDDYKKICTTFIQASALPVIERLGIKDAIEAAGGVRNSADFWTKWGRIAATRDEVNRDLPAHGYSIRRQELDPILRANALSTPGVELMLGMQVKTLIEEDGRIVGVRCQTGAGPEVSLRAPLVVAADGRGSRMAELAGVPAKMRDNKRFVYYAYYRNLPLKSGQRSQFWVKDRGMGFAYPFGHGLTMLCCFAPHDELPQWKDDLDGAFRRFYADLPEAPELGAAERVTGFKGMLRLDDARRPSVWKGMALVGDAAISADPMSGVGCGWAMQSASWMADAVLPAFRGARPLEKCLADYRSLHRKRLWGHEFFIADSSAGRSPNLLEKMISIAAVHDQTIANYLHAFMGRHIGVGRFLSPRNLLRIAAANVGYLLRRQPAPAVLAVEA
ncbi:NAD(P)/FAD-dependent oxidoreductase [Noviherbaspirillum denitrificans]|uniref:FAD-binding domain-containing protein n=1 Tax=Noviherbaspirillum denitrificans TaxID=1968433 RepID=A0A254TER4_9BURK|nr:NAD(P)/FAD-dependent oxidoreductase [Noviherbaspirillum denitrificans]OWW21025.1 hypothetical protein AYR66_17635 [Noviherbaspirillum denitrificans]